MPYKRPAEIQPEPLILADRELVDYTDDYMLHDSMCEPEIIGKRQTGRLRPNFTVTEVSRFFYGKTTEWLRWRLKNHHFILDGEEVGIKRDSLTGFRYFTLADIERMTHALGQRGALNGAEVTTTLIIVRNVAKLYGIIR